jgi:choline dehydrogenase-like flavoprotein
MIQRRIADATLCRQDRVEKSDGVASAADDVTAVLDPRFLVRGVSALRVVDASALPLIISGNTCSPTLMMAEKTAGWILADAV